MKNLPGKFNKPIRNGEYFELKINSCNPCQSTCPEQGRNYLIIVFRKRLWLYNLWVDILSSLFRSPGYDLSTRDFKKDERRHKRLSLRKHNYRKNKLSFQCLKPAFNSTFFIFKAASSDERGNKDR